MFQNFPYFFVTFCELNPNQKAYVPTVVAEFPPLLGCKSIKRSSQRLAFISAIMISALMSCLDMLHWLCSFEWC